MGSITPFSLQEYYISILWRILIPVCDSHSAKFYRTVVIAFKWKSLKSQKQNAENSYATDVQSLWALPVPHSHTSRFLRRRCVGVRRLGRILPREEAALGVDSRVAFPPSVSSRYALREKGALFTEFLTTKPIFWVLFRVYQCLSRYFQINYEVNTIRVTQYDWTVRCFLKIQRGVVKFLTC